MDIFDERVQTDEKLQMDEIVTLNKNWEYVKTFLKELKQRKEQEKSGDVKDAINKISKEFNTHLALSEEEHSESGDESTSGMSGTEADDEEDEKKKTKKKKS